MACCGLRPLQELLLVFLGALICGFIPVVTFIVQIIRKGPRRMFCYRSRDVRPEILRNSEFGAHEFFRLPVGDLCRRHALKKLVSETGTRNLHDRI